MNSSLKLTLLSFLLVLLSQSTQADAPDISLEDLNGNYHSISEYIGHGKWTLVNVWSPTCIQCAVDMPDLNKFHLKHRDTDATVLGITIDFPSFKYGKKDLATAFIKKYNISFPILMGDQDLASQVSGKRLKAIPTTYFFHPDGNLVARWPGMVKKEELEEFIRRYEPETDDWFK
jgi:peroxiredoxin